MHSTGHLIFFGAYLCAALAWCTWSDLIRRTIPNWANATLLMGAIGLALLSPAHAVDAALLGSLIGVAVFLGVAIGFHRFRGYHGLGLGDVKFMAGAGAWVGWQGLAPLTLIASVSALLYIAMMRIRHGRFDPNTQLPFGPFLSFATLLVWCAQVVGGQYGSFL